MDLKNFQRYRIRGKNGKELVRYTYTKGKCELIGGYTGSGKTYYIAKLVSELSLANKSTKVFLNYDTPHSFLIRMLEVGKVNEIKENVAIQSLYSKDEDPQRLAKIIADDSLKYDVVIVDSVLSNSIKSLFEMLENVDSKVILVTQLNRP